MTNEAPLPGAWGWDEGTRRGFDDGVAALVRTALAPDRDSPAVTPVPRPLAADWAGRPWPADGLPAAELLRQLAEEVVPYPFGNGHPRFHAWVNSAPDRAAVAVESLAAAMDPSVAGGNHAAVHLERLVVRWLADLVGMPAGAGGLLTSGTSQGTVVALAAARHRAAPQVRERGLAAAPRLVVYASPEAHSCVAKAVQLLGLGSGNLRAVPTTADRRMDPAALAGMLAEDTAAGSRPMAVVASAGSVNTGTVDPLAELAAMCRREQVWFHVDGAYGGPAVLSARYRSVLAAMAEADSVCLDPHKWLYVPVDSSVVCVRDPDALRSAFSLVPAYLRTGEPEDPLTGGAWFSEYGMEQTRPFRALKTWAALAATGRAGYTRLIERDLALADRLAAAVEADPRLELLAHGLSVVVFAAAGPAGADTDARTVAAGRALTAGGRHYLAPTVLDGRAALRCCLVNPLTSVADLDLLVGRCGDLLAG